ncbi:Putative ppx/GppA phosphatase, ATPase, nucleotide binding domain-containing protein [Colletotrichum destructivum]|uniref:Ppx/GppA phosphatase, ATPase, nucleotide binding domain-containing protein n=1 Tax=Colletotrichum destructivum TaxID=34406 RepID=A0AAX4I557_9PEZI|nr:Putative ppx/GppA phosphatase, ATPase, nucleotide binding domain-containing protein [Colletotrichum destructivum]
MASSSDIITLDNFEQLLPRWDPAGPNHLYALVDMGSNGIRFSISDLTPPQTRLLRPIYRERAGISLFDALNTNPSSDDDAAAAAAATKPMTFPAETIAQVARTLARFRRIAVSYGVPPAHFSVLATEAMRRAANAREMLAAIRAAADIGVHVLAPEVETLFGAVMGSRSAFVDISRGGLFLDLGGGSVQMTWVDTRLPDYEIAAALAGESMPFGAARLIRVLEGQPEEVRAQERQKLNASMQGAFAKLCDRFPALAQAKAEHAAAATNGTDTGTSTGPVAGGIDAYLCGGGFRGYGCMLQHNDPIQPYPLPSVGTYTVTGDFFKQTDKMRRVHREHEGKIYGMSKRRRQQFPAIIEVVEAFIRAVPHLRTVTFCGGSNRDGALLMKLPKSVRESNPLEALAGFPIQGHHEDAGGSGGGGGGRGDMAVIARAVLRTLYGAVPVNVDISRTPTVFSLGLGPLFARQVWIHQGEDDDANASYALHEAVTRDPSAPGLTHLARAVLGLTTCARWGSNLGPIDAQLYGNLKGLVAEAKPESIFWAEYLGAVAAVMVDLVPAWPETVEELESTLRFEATQTVDPEKKRASIELTVHVAAAAAVGIDPEDVKGRLSNVGKKRKDGTRPDKKVTVRLLEMKQ